MLKSCLLANLVATSSLFSFDIAFLMFPLIFTHLSSDTKSYTKKVFLSLFLSLTATKVLKLAWEKEPREFDFCVSIERFLMIYSITIIFLLTTLESFINWFENLREFTKASFRTVTFVLDSKVGKIVHRLVWSFHVFKLVDWTDFFLKVFLGNW